MAEAIYLPKLGMTMEEGTLQRWLLPDGAQVSKGQPVFELETEKVQMEVEAEADGTLKQLVAEGTTLKPGDIVGALLAAGEALPQQLVDAVTSQGHAVASASKTPSAGPSPVAEAPSAAPARDQKRVSPIARRLATENGIDIATLTGSGPDGRIVERDVMAAIEARDAAPQAPPQQIRPAAEGAPVSGSTPYSGRRRTIGERMLQSVTTMAQLTLVTEAPVGEAMTMLHGLNREWRGDRVVVTLTALVVKASALALKEHPRFNSRLANDQIVSAPRFNVGVAVDVDEGLIVPVIYDADSASLKQIATALRDLTDRARENMLTPDDVSGGTFTITSLEGSGVDAFTPVINPPQAAILGIGRIRDVPVFDGANVTRGQATTLSLTFDHRISDGAPAARFLDRIVELLGRPYLLM
ncbi:MAG TPA: dihydrolipoamide acetyltransferase family protein [Dehalococcoidia bacterium]|nr:dihydrolipoamide acetyltransferase family protein [Dehalococcoidia bacterium]